MQLTYKFIIFLCTHKTFVRYRGLLNEKRTELGESCNKLANGLAKLEESRVQVSSFTCYSMFFFCVCLFFETPVKTLVCQHNVHDIFAKEWRGHF